MTVETLGVARSAGWAVTARCIRGRARIAIEPGMQLPLRARNDDIGGDAPAGTSRSHDSTANCAARAVVIVGWLCCEPGSAKSILALFSGGLSGGRTRTRTLDPLIKNPQESPRFKGPFRQIRPE